MVYRRKRKFTPKRKFKRRFRRRRSKYRKKARARMVPIGTLGKSQVMRFRYTDHVQINVGANSFAYHTFRVNSLFDPDRSGTGHQPKGFDEMAGYFSHYTVLGSKITVKWVTGTSGSVTPPCYFGCTVTQNSTDLSNVTSVNSLLETPGLGMPRHAGFSGGLNSDRWKTLARKWSAKKWTRKNTKAIIEDSLLSAPISDNPGNSPLYNLWCSSIAANDPATQTFFVSIDYYAVMTRPKVIATTS